MNIERVNKNADMAYQAILNTPDMNEAYAALGLVTGHINAFVAHDCKRTLNDEAEVRVSQETGSPSEETEAPGAVPANA